MLISFSVRNFRTFRDKVEWSLIASADKTREEDNVVELPGFGLRLLKSAVVYGANASGKSKLVEAMKYMRQFIHGSSKNGQAGELTGVEPFRLNSTSVHTASDFEIQFVYQEQLYRYGFELTSTQVKAEWLFVRNVKAVRNKPEIELFYREGQNITFHPRQFGGIVSELVKTAAVRENALLLSVAAQFNQSRAINIFKWFSGWLPIPIVGGSMSSGITFMRLRDADSRQAILNFLSDSDLDIEDIREGSQPNFSFQEGEDPSEGTKRMKLWTTKEYADVKTLHQVYNDARELVESVEFSLAKDESEGTKTMFALAGWVVSTIIIGGVLVVDELDARLHPNLVAKIVQLFNSKTTNPNNAQLLFNTHDTNLLTSGNFRRDQIWFTEKNRYGEATLYSLADFKTDVVRKGDNIEANYVRGKYGAVPYLGNFNALPQTDATPETAPDHE